MLGGKGRRLGGRCRPLAVGRRRAGHTRRHGHGRRCGDRGRARPFHLSAQVSPLQKNRANSPFTRPGVVSYACSYAPRNRQYAEG
ncbi:hypothetical protein C1J00_03350 [Streptomyces cahuitamycinicus]|uniref:Uncharacterized protein n=1 Tax=Streptomyces cahuitamycinicus TaxID=2070367 RepID=A0A2N8TX93_9ACTN|nr:hypothetical protein C1J00_03350 [Streptomyces cahuitamycinicus]